MYGLLNISPLFGLIGLGYCEFCGSLVMSGKSANFVD